MEQPKLQIRMLPVSSLVPYANNAKKHPDEQIQEIVNSFEQFGNCDPIAVWHNERGEPEIVEGHGRALALKKLGCEAAPVIFLDHLSDEQRRGYTHVHNQTTLSSGFDDGVLFDDLDNLNFDFESLGFKGYAIEEMDMNVDDVEDRESELVYITVKNKKWPIAEDECELFIEKMTEWIDDTGLPYGFIRSMLDG